MSTLVTVSPIDKGKHIPSRQERDEAFSSGAGRKAIEKPKKDREKEIFHQKNMSEKQEASQASDHVTDAPIGLELETRIMPSVGSALEEKARNS